MVALSVRISGSRHIGQAAPPHKNIQELASLEKISDHHPKILLTLDEVGADTNHNGVRQLNALDWLLER